MSALSDNNLIKLEAQHRAGAWIIASCTKSTPVSALMTESDLLPFADQADITSARLHERALRHRQDTPIAKATRRSEEIAQRGDTGRRIRTQARHSSNKSSWRDTAQDITRRAGVDLSTVEPMVLGPHCGQTYQEFTFG